MIFLIVNMGCTEQGVQAKNANPTAQITSHEDGAEAMEGYATLIRGNASDPDNDPLNLTAIWYLGPDEICRVTPDADGISTCEIILNTEGVVTLEVRDPQDAAGVDSVTFDVSPTEAPIAILETPATEDILFSNQAILLSAVVSDAEDNPEDLTVWWESSVDGDLSFGGTPDSSGQTSDTTYLSEGVHTLTVWVEDSTLKTGSDSTSIQVGAPNEPPECEIVSPEENINVLSGQQLAFIGQAQDPDGINDALVVEWFSDKDGLLGNSFPDSSGVVNFSTDELSIETHTISFRAEDPYGLFCTSNVVVTVSTPPIITIETPLADSVFSHGEPITFLGTISDGEDSPSDLQMSWVSNIDGEFSTESADSFGEINLTTSALSMGSHILSITVTDSSELFDTFVLPIHINTPPTQPTVDINPNPAYTTDTLICLPFSSDADGQTVGFTYLWLRNGLSTSYTSSNLPSTATGKNQSWTCSVTPNDGFEDGPTGDATLNILNSPPTINLMSILPGNNVTSTEFLTCSALSSDPDAEPLTTAYEWTNNGNQVGQLAELDLGQLNAQFGDAYTCIATVTDLDGASVSSSSTATVSNAPPVIDSLTITPSNPDTNSLLGLSLSATDPEGDPISYDYQWRVNGVLQPDIGPTLDGSLSFSKDDLIASTVTPSDPTQSGISVSAIATIINTPPSSASVSITPASPVSGQDDLICEISTPSSDQDNDTLTYSIYWEVDGIPYPDGDTASGWIGPITTYITDDTVAAADTLPGELWTCTITPNDGDDDGLSSNASTVIQIGLTGWYWNGAYWYTASSTGMSCDQVCSAEGLTFDVVGSTHSGNQVGQHFWPTKSNGSNWVAVECSSTDNNTNWGADNSTPSGSWTHSACHVNCACH